jgi:hypothetical protein
VIKGVRRLHGDPAATPPAGQWTRFREMPAPCLAPWTVDVPENRRAGLLNPVIAMAHRHAAARIVGRGAFRVRAS